MSTYGYLRYNILADKRRMYSEHNKPINRTIELWFMPADLLYHTACTYSRLAMGWGSHFRAIKRLQSPNVGQRGGKGVWGSKVRSRFISCGSCLDSCLLYTKKRRLWGALFRSLDLLERWPRRVRNKAERRWRDVNPSVAGTHTHTHTHTPFVLLNASH